jgi:hypothetical protein
MTNQSDRQADARSSTSTTLTYEGDSLAYFDSQSVPAGDYNGRLLAWINQALGTSYTEINGAKNALAVSGGAPTWDGLALLGTAGAFVNINPTTTANFKAAYLAQAANIPIAFMGDSTMRGVDETALPYNSQYPNAGPMVVASLLNAAAINAGASNWYGLSGTSFNDYMIRDSRVAATGAATTGSIVAQGGSNVQLETSAGSFSFTTPANATKAKIYTIDFFAGAQWSWQVDAGAPTTITQAGANTIVETIISLGTAGLHTVKISWVSGNNELYGIECYDDTAGRKEITCRQWGISGGTSGSMIDNTGTPHSGRLQQLSQFPPKLVISECGLVNDWRTSVSVATSKANMLTLINAVKAAGSDFWFLTPPYDGGVAGLTANQDAYVAAMYQLVVSENVGLLDIRKLWKSYANEVSAGLVGDAVHPTKSAGYPSQAQLIYNGLRKII